MPSRGVHHIPLPTPFAVGDVNTYLVEDDPLTLVDVGPDSGTALVALSRGLAEHGRRLEDLERVVLTHQHLDHVGLAHLVCERSGAELWGFGPMGPWLADYDTRAEADDRYAEQLMLRHGVAPETATALRSLARMTRKWGTAAALTHALRDGDTVPFADRTWKVHHRPGHSPSDLVFQDQAAGELVSGDHLIRNISSNALVTLPLDGTPPDDHPHPLRTYMTSLEATARLEADLLLPGHGPSFGDHAALVASRLDSIERRARKIHTMLAGGPLTIHEIAQAIWGTVAVTQAYLTTSEVLGHLDILLERGAVAEVEDDGVVRFAQA